MKIYVSGSISARPLDEARATFRKAEEYLRQGGHEAVCPFDNSLPATASWERHMSIDIIMLLGCDAIYMLQGWEISRGATLERMIAIETGKIIIYERQPELQTAKDAIAMTTAHSFCDLMGTSRERKLVDARIIFAQHCATQGLTVAQIAEQLQKDTSTVGYYLRQYVHLSRYNQHFQRTANRFSQNLRELESAGQEQEQDRQNTTL